MRQAKSPKFSPNYKSNKFKFVFLLIILLAIPVTVYLANRLAFLLPSAQQASTQLTLINQTSGNTNNVTLRIAAGSNQVGFAKVVVLFDRSKLRLNSEVVPSTRLKTVAVKTSMADANSTGRIEVSLGLSTDDQANPPTGTFDLAQMSFTSLSSTLNDPTRISIDQVNSLIGNLEPTSLAVTATNLNLILNFQPTSSPTVRPTATATLRPTVTAKPTPTVRPTTTLRPTASPRATSTVRPTTTPRVTAKPESNRPVPRFIQAIIRFLERLGYQVTRQ